MSSVLVGGTDAAANAAQAAALINSSKYRAYVAAVDKALKAFEATNEWADLISALAKLSRVFHSNAKFGDIPKPVTVAKRLSQCLHPALPHGVHLKALETYRQVFDILGQKDLPRLLYLFAVGLFPLMDHCGIKVKSELLSIFEQYLLPLGANLKPALPGFITGVLLGLEEGTEFYDRSFALLDQVQVGVGAESFFACLWEAVLGSPSVRLPALIYVNAKFDRHKTMDDQIFIMGDHVDHMIAALCAVADDDGSTLVQRNLLDFLCTAFPLNSDHLVKEDFVQLLRRCIFVILRRDMSLNRRLYQWLLNRCGDSSVSSIPVGGTEELIDTSFFKMYVLPLIEKAVEEYLKLDTVEVASASAAWDGTKEHQMQFTEVRVCRLLLYFLDRPELGSLILEKTLSMLLEFSSRNYQEVDAVLPEEDGFWDSCGTSASQSGTYCDIGRRASIVSRSSNASRRSKSSILQSSHDSKEMTTEQVKRLDEFSKTFNLLLNSLDVGFIWRFLESRFNMILLSDVCKEVNGTFEPGAISTETRNSRDEVCWKNAEELRMFPKVLLFCLRTVELDSHGDIRGIHLPQLLYTVLSCVVEKNVKNMETNFLVQLICVTKAVLVEINQSAVAIDAGMQNCASASNGLDTTEDNASVTTIHGRLVDEEAEEQKMIEKCLVQCQRLLAQVCDWYCSRRSTGRLRVFRVVCSLQRDFADFPLYNFIPRDESSQRIANRAPSFVDHKGYPDWLDGLLRVISAADDKGSVHFQTGDSEDEESDALLNADFLARADALDLVTYVYVRSASVAEQHTALFGRRKHSYELLCHGIADDGCRKGGTTVLLKPLLSELDLERMDNDGVFQKAAQMVWARLGDPKYIRCHEVAARLLTLLHSRRAFEPSSDTEELIVGHLTSPNKSMSGAAAKKFRTLWTLSRRTAGEDVYPGLQSKQFNRVIMILLGILTDDAIGYEKAELRNIASAWFIDCAKHNDLPRILQMLAVMLLNPTTARISIQYLSVHNRLNREQITSMPPGICAITLLTEGGRHSLHHLCEDVSAAADGSGLKKSREIAAILDQLRNSHEMPAWYSELRNCLLQAGDTDGSMDVSIGVNNALKSHRRTVSDLPIFDEDNESLGAESIDSVDHGVAEVLQYLIDCVCDEEERQLKTATPTPERSSVDRVTATPSPNDNLVGVDDPDVKETTAFRVGDSSSKLAVDAAEMAEQQPTPKASECSAVLSDNIKRVKSGHRRQDSLQESIFTMTAQELKLFDAAELPRLNAAGDEKQPLCHELHAHMLLYAESGRIVDLARAEKILRMLIALMRGQRSSMTSRMIVSCMVSSGTASLPKRTSGGSSSQLIELLSRHVRAILGQEFWASNDSESGSSSDATKSKHYTFLELFMTVSLYFLRSYYLNSPTTPVSDLDLRVAWKCKVAALDLLTELVREIISMIRDNQSRALVAYVHGILQRSKLQKCLLHSLLTSVHNARATSDAVVPLSVDILEFNEGPSSCVDQFEDLLSGYHSSLLNLAAVVIQLELDVKNGFQNFTDQNMSGIYMDKLSINHQIYNSPQHRSTLREPHVSMVELRMFLLTVLNALKRNPSRHEQWQLFVVQILPFLDRSLPTFCIHVVEQLCKNVESAVNAAYRPSGENLIGDSVSFVADRRDSASASVDPVLYPPNYAVGALETLTTFVHFCLIDNSSQASSAGSTIANAHQPSPGTSGSGNAPSISSSMMNAIPGTRGATELISNLVKVFSFGDSSSVSSNAALAKYSDRANGGSWKQAKTEMLNSFPHALATICDVWTLVRKGGEPVLPIGSAGHIRRLILDLLSPIAQHHQQSFLSALALVWLTRSSVVSQKQIAARIEPDQPSFVYSDAQLDIADLLLSIKVLPFENLIATVADTLKECAGRSLKPPASTEKQSPFPTEVSLLEMLHGCVRATPVSALHNCWAPLQSLFAESPIMNLPPKAIFIQFIILADFVRLSGSASIVEDKQISRAVQDACQKLTEAVNVIVGWQLEQTTWLKRTLVVKHDSGQKSQETSPVVEYATAPSSLAASEANSLRGSTTSLVPSRLVSCDSASTVQATQSFASSSDKKSSSNLRASIKDTNNNKRDPANSTQALFLLAENLAELIDSICKSEDKERLLPTLHAVWNNTLPYLKAKNARNARFFLASSQFLASMSTFNYMRPVWRKATLELLLDPAFFKMDMNSLKQWLIVIDHLMTHDKTSFKELLARISTAQNSALSSLITSKEAEYEMRAQALKRLAFTVLSSELDQYQIQLPDIQERLSDNLRQSQVPNVHAQVFLCYRVLFLRLKPQHLVSMWPSMVTELVHVLLQIEQQLTGTANVSDDLKCDRNDQWMQLYLAACKLLETLCTLPSGYMAQFQMCHWAFVTSVASSNTDSFVPFAGRINTLLCNKYGKLTANEKKLVSASLMNVKTLTSFSELRPFFLALATQNKLVSVTSAQIGGDKDDQLRDACFMNGTLTYRNAITRLEHSLYVDFAEHWQL